jgi:hypothetical protein
MTSGRATGTARAHGMPTTAEQRVDVTHLALDRMNRHGRLRGQSTIPAPTVALLASSIRMKLPVVRLVR